jgi:hypothetical protein
LTSAPRLQRDASPASRPTWRQSVASAHRGARGMQCGFSRDPVRLSLSLSHEHAFATDSPPHAPPASMHHPAFTSLPSSRTSTRTRSHARTIVDSQSHARSNWRARVSFSCIPAFARDRVSDQSPCVGPTESADGLDESPCVGPKSLCRTKVPVSDRRSLLTGSTTVALLTRVPSRARRQVSPLNPRLHRRFQLMRFGFRSLHTTSGHTGKPRMFRMYSKVAGCIIVVVTS